MNSYLPLLALFVIQLSIVLTISIHKPAATSNHSYLFNKISRPRFKNVIINSNIVMQLNAGDNLIIECPLSQTSQKFNKLNREAHANMKSTPIFITSWYKNQIKINQFIDENIERIKFTEKKLKIKDLTKTDSGVYSCEIITGTGLSVTNSNLTLLVNEIVPDTDFKSGEEMSSRETTSEPNDYQPNESNQVSSDDTPSDLNEYVKGEKPVFEDDDQEIKKYFSQLESTQALLDCSSRGIPSPQIIWLKNGKIMSEEDYGLIRNVMKLNLKGLSLSDSGVYVCQVSNQFGKLNRTFNLRVFEKLKLANGEETNMTASLNESALLTCKLEPYSFTSASDTTYKWFVHANDFNNDNTVNGILNKTQTVSLNGVTYFQLDLAKEVNRPVQLNAKFSLFLSKSLDPHVNNLVQLEDGSFLIKKFNSTNIGSYLCVANNSRGFNYRRVRLSQMSGNEIPAQPVANIANEIRYDILINSNQGSAATSQLNFKSPKSTDLINKPDHLLSTPVIIIISVSTVSVVLIVFLVCFYKHI